MENSTFQRQLHDKEHPYVMIANSMFRDKSISLASKGLLGYLLGLPDTWIVHPRKVAEEMGVGINQIYNLVNELIENGYCDRHQANENGKFQKTWYVFREYKSQVIDNVPSNGNRDTENRNAEKQTLVINKDKNKEKEQQQAAAVSYEFLDKIDIPLNDKAWLVENYEELVIKHACKWALHPSTKIKSTLQQAIKWACENKPEIPKLEVDNSAENKKTAAEILKTLKENKIYRLEVLNKGIEITPMMGNQLPYALSYSEKGFKDQLMNALRKYQLI